MTTTPPPQQTAITRSLCLNLQHQTNITHHIRPCFCGLAPLYFQHRLPRCLISQSQLALCHDSGGLPWSPQCRKSPKLTKPVQPSDFRPVSITPVLSRAFERHIVIFYIHPALKELPPELHFADQFAFKPTGSTTTAIITFLHTVLVRLSANPCVHVFSFTLY